VIAQGVVDGQAADGGDDPVLPAVLLGPQRQQELVEVVRPGGEAQLGAGDDHRGTGWVRGRERDRLQDVHVAEVAALGGEPALLAQPGGQRLLGQRAQVTAHEVSRRHRRRPPRQGAPP
jgi:hypothetical protein